MSQPVLFVVGVLLGVVGALVALRARRTARLVHTLRTLDTTPISALGGGIQLIEGTVETGGNLPSLFQQRDCAYYAYRVEDEPPGVLEPKRLATGKDWGELWVRDHTGRVRVDHRPALIRSPRTHVAELGRLREIPPEHANFFEKAGIDSKHLPRFHNLRVVEYTLEPGAKVYVLGSAREEADEKVFYRAPRSPLAVSQSRDAGLIPGLKNELLLFSLAAVVLGTFSLLFLGVAFA